jgi:hypothetical protein
MKMIHNNKNNSHVRVGSNHVSHSENRMFEYRPTDLQYTLRPLALLHPQTTGHYLSPGDEHLFPHPLKLSVQ